MVAYIKFYRPLIFCTLAGVISLPPLYLLVMIQYGAVTFPFWDHLTTVVQIEQYFDGTLL
jgi:hypothetical protein